MEIPLGYVIGGIGSIVGITSFAMSRMDRVESKRKGIYQRIEQERRDADKKFTSMELCDERSGNFEKQLANLQKGQEQILTEVKKRNGNG